MSTTPLTDAITALTTYSNTVTGASDTDLSSAVATLAAGYGGGGGGGTWSYEQVTIGSNSVTNTASAYDYFGHTDLLAIMTTNADTYNQMQGVIRLASYSPACGTALRYRNGNTSGVSIANSYDAVLVEGTVYDVFYQD